MIDALALIAARLGKVRTRTLRGSRGSQRAGRAGLWDTRLNLAGAAWGINRGQRDRVPTSRPDHRPADHQGHKEAHMDTTSSTFDPFDLSAGERRVAERDELRRQRNVALIQARNRRAACRGVNIAELMEQAPTGIGAVL